ncbi:MAG: hypothetical protein HRU70_06265 [Phycisphaeraceae bacterium]|nr:MAG: hypothetical protein HRU70_06265 [Phycisphaeraceae bacterium]
MAERRSLTSGLGLEKEAPAKGKGPKGKDSDGGSVDSGKTIKLTLAVVGIAVGGVLVAWNFGLFDSLNAPPAADAQGNAPGHVIPESEKERIRRYEERRQLPDGDPNKPIESAG